MSRSCRKCLLPEGVFAVTLDSGGQCNYCRYFESHRDAFTRFDVLRPALRRRLDKLRGRYEFDAVVGLSGGKDSTYVAYRLAHEYGLRLLGVTYENGFLTDVARANIDNVVSRLGIEHHFHTPDWDAHRQVYTAALKTFGDPCIGCAVPGYFLSIKFCAERRVPFFVHGRSPYQMLRNFYADSPDAFIPMMMANLRPHDFGALAALYAGIDARIEQWLQRMVPDPEVRVRIRREFFVDPARLAAGFAPEFLGFFLFEPYDEEDIKRTLETELGWKRPPRDDLLAHPDCRIHDAAAGLFSRIHGLSMTAPEVAVMLRLNRLTGPEALDLIRRSEPPATRVESAVGELCDRLGVDRQSVDATIDRLKSGGAAKFDSH